jgi:predicted ferric reductase
MLVLLFITFYGVIFSYRSLKNAHRFMGLTFFLATLHMFLIPSTIQSDLVIRYSCLGMAGIGLLAFTYRTLLGNFVAPHFTYSVSAVKTIGQNIFEITLTPVAKALRHIPGQFAMLSLNNSTVVSAETHPFTISSSRDNGDIRFSIRGLGDYTSLLGGLQVGTTANIEGPYGEFYYGYATKSQVWVAGGIGVTPFVSMAEDLLAKESIDYTIDFYYSVRTQADAAYQELFAALKEKHPSFIFHLVPSDTAGYITAGGIIKDIADATARSFFVCGPPPMMSALIEALIVSGVNDKLIHSEKFSLLK